jgi:hypothetical protein
MLISIMLIKPYQSQDILAWETAMYLVMNKALL